MTTSADFRYRLRIADSESDLSSVQALRHQCFFGAAASGRGGRDKDGFDKTCTHILVEEAQSGSLVACCRLLPLTSGRAVEQSYSAQFYDLEALTSYRSPMIEIGRYCTAEGALNADVHRLIWGAIARFVDQQGAGMLIGCSSFAGTDSEAHRAAFDLLAEDYLAPPKWGPRPKAAKIFRFADQMRNTTDRRRGLLKMPPLLKSYIAMGGWVSDHAVVDHNLGTLHVFTGLEVARIPQQRQRRLRALAG